MVTSSEAGGAEKNKLRWPAAEGNLSLLGWSWFALRFVLIQNFIGEIPLWLDQECFSLEKFCICFCPVSKFMYSSTLDCYYYVFFQVWVYEIRKYMSKHFTLNKSMETTTIT